MDNDMPVRRGRPTGPRSVEGELTTRQGDIVRFITDTVQRQGYPPSMREIGHAVQLASTSSVAYQLMALERKGVLYRDPHRPRAYRVRPSWAPDLGRNSEAPVDVPLVGRIAAGAPLLAEEMVEDVYSLPRQVVGDGDLFALTVSGDSMIDAAICDGDIVTVRRQDSADHGDIVAALLEDEATVKVLRRQDGRVWLMPRNPAYEPIPGDQAQILGKVVGVLRVL
ncbi:transcriptional repressor LexA [Streptomyces sp. NBC_01340]|uniref:transcriptional repressor LexA n=1 Tax=unclassified Streptomyces TaxID=2593676 RepID=UPI00224D224E|nr:MULTISPECIES: transcriptional repressor LexA [unclassified Streptomyces]MCX4459890.1 transcriptional repressor LexA [Streptomyces sp. NBC_01719]MCX4499248.1 transcriptional repressor LexA [Streptomyces sp. NBC_01728]MCX4594832.1 transcriptional repressor LexA [Streptomyces sp. NBC_01549]WSI43654.1 transcriptional repressor LexA [Streptomyces sp. NBC_01340]